MMVRMTGALARAFLVMVMVATPSLMLPHVTADSAQIVALIAIFAAVLIFFEYVSVYPGLVEFRDAPPFNRIRFVSLFLTIFLISLVIQAREAPSAAAQLVEVLGTALGESIDLPYSPVRLVLSMLPPDASPDQIGLVRTAAGLSYAISLSTLAVFVMVLRSSGWPVRPGGFNVWVNLPTFDPTTGGDVVARLHRDAWVNIGLGFLLPFAIPAAISMAMTGFAPIGLYSPQTLVWTLAAWAFLPASLFMRGIAMGRIAHMIELRRRLVPAGEAELATA